MEDYFSPSGNNTCDGRYDRKAADKVTILNEKYCFICLGIREWLIEGKMGVVLELSSVGQRMGMGTYIYVWSYY